MFADLTAHWLDAALRSAGELDVTVIDLQVEPLGAEVGFLGDLARVTPTYGSGADLTRAPASFVVKLPPTDAGAHRIGSMLRAWSREVAFYAQVAPLSSEIQVPRCFYGGADEANERWVLVLDDLAVGMASIDLDAGATRKQAEAAIDALAVFHARWWQANERFDWMPGFDTTGVGGLQSPWLDAHPHFLDRYGHLCPEPSSDWLTTFAPRLTEWSTKAAREPITIVHGDYRLDNVIFVDAQVMMIDWQTALRGPAAMDVSSFIASSLSTDNRSAWESQLISRYLDGVGRAGIEVDAVWFNDSYDENLLWWMGQFANNLAHLKPDEPHRQRALDTMVVRIFTAALDRNVGRLL